MLESLCLLLEGYDRFSVCSVSNIYFQMFHFALEICRNHRESDGELKRVLRIPTDLQQIKGKQGFLADILASIECQTALVAESATSALFASEWASVTCCSIFGRLYPRHASALNNLGTLTKDVVEAKDYYRRALQLNPQHNRALFNLGNLLK